MKKEIGITAKKDKNFSDWYTQVIQKAELIEYSKVSGCIVFRPSSYSIWEKIQSYLDSKFKKLGVKNAYFPMFIPESLLSREESHIEGFSAEVAWVTHTGNTKLNERLAIRPTSETIMYDSYKKWIRSYKDLPLRLNQWCSVVRWEFKYGIPFLRTREFLWQEGHTAFSNRKDADKEVLQILDVYAKVYEDLLAVPVIKGRKSEKEKFAGALYTTSVEMFLPNGRAIQGATSHSLGKNFAKAFDIKFVDKEERKQYVWQNSWGITTRTIGIMIMMHSDNNGLVLPPRIVENKVVIIPIIFEKTKERVLKKAKEIKVKLRKYNTLLDDRDDYSAGWKFNEWELKGIPIRIEIGPKDLEKKQVVLVRRDTLKKEIVKIRDIDKKVEKTLENIQKNLFEKAKKFLKDSIVNVKNFNDFKKAINNKKLVRAFWCGEVGCEDWIKDKTGGAKSINIPFDQPKKLGKCIHCDKEGKYITYFAKSY